MAIQQKTCPYCSNDFSRSPRQYITWARCKANVCPTCETPLFYRKTRGKLDKVVLLEDKLTVDAVMARIAEHKSLNSDFVFEAAATVRERKFTWDLLSWARDFLNGAEADIGMTVHDFLLGFFNYLFRDPWWGDNFSSILMIKNTKQDLAWKYWESEARKRGVDTPRSSRVHNKLQALLAEM